MNTLELVLTPLVFVGGFVLGFVGGVKYQKRKLTREVAVEARVLRVWLGRTLDVVTSRRFVGVFMIFTALLVYHDQRQHAHQRSQDTARIAASAAQVKQLGLCVATYENRLSASLQPRQRASKKLQRADNRFNDAFVVVLDDIFAVPADPAKSKADALILKARAQEKQQVARHLNAERATNPYPSPPRKVCPQ